METSRSFLLYNARPPYIRMFASVVVLGGIIIAFLFAYVAFGEESNNNTTLKQVNIVFRHGDKNPTSFYVNDPYKDPSLWPEGWGQLTLKGKKQIFQLGQTLHTRYGNFLGPYSPQTIRVDSSDLDRCHQSAAVLLAALFPPQTGQVWNDLLLWQPIAIHSASRDVDKLITVTAPCPLYEEEKKRSDAELANKYGKENEELYKYLSKETGENISTLLDVETIFNVLEIEECSLNEENPSVGNLLVEKKVNNKNSFKTVQLKKQEVMILADSHGRMLSELLNERLQDSGKTLPSWTEPVFPDKMKDIAALVLASFTYTPIMKKLRGGPLVSAITSNMNSLLSGTSKKRLSLYAAHDITIVHVRRAMGFDDLTFKPQLGAALIVELHDINAVPQVELYYLESYEARTPVRWQLPNCPSPCSLASFSEAMAPVIPRDWVAECQLK